MRVVVDASRLPPDLRSVELLAALQVAARRRDGGLDVRAAPDELRRLVELVGLTRVLGLDRRPRCFSVVWTAGRPMRAAS